jgi:carboxylesterase type B
VQKSGSGQRKHSAGSITPITKKTEKAADRLEGCLYKASPQVLLVNQQRKLEVNLAAFKVMDAATKRAAQLAAHHINKLSAIVEKIVVEGQKKSTDSATTTDTLHKQIKGLKQCVQRSICGFSRAVACTKEKSSFCWMMAEGIYTVHTRKLARIMADGRCACRKIGPMMERIGQVFGVHIDRAMS